MEKRINVRTSVLPHNPESRVLTDALVREALAWRRFAAGRATLSEEALDRKMLESLAFSIQVRARAFAVPTKLSGTRDRQQAIGELLKTDAHYGTRLVVNPAGRDQMVSHEGIELGLIQAKHSAWLAPLVCRGAGVHLLAITGLSSRGYCGVNVAVSQAGVAAIRAEAALREMAEGRDPGRMHGQERRARVKATPQTSGDRQAALAPGSGDGQADPNPALHLALSRYDVRVWRTADGQAHISVPHVCLHSPTGPEWGYCGSGPKDAALSILCAFIDVVRAERLAHDFCADVIARIPREGGVLPAAFIARWLLARSK